MCVCMTYYSIVYLRVDMSLNNKREICRYDTVLSAYQDSFKNSPHTELESFTKPLGHSSVQLF